MALLTLAEYKGLLAIDPTDTRNDAQITALLDAASRAVQGYTERDFSPNTGIATARNYLYDGSGFLDIDDCTAITSVTINIPNAASTLLDPLQWTSMPDNEPIFYYLLLHSVPGVYTYSPAMGFNNNLDTFSPQSFKSPTLSVIATWGWPAVPSDVKLATALTIREFTGSGGRAEGLTSEAIEGYSRSWGARTGSNAPSLAIPNRARDLLINYQRSGY